ncbi:MAG: hypothetical protein HC801_07810 [Nitrospira sp.]|nr:hypothetical protein [Nitrospira sp.]
MALIPTLSASAGRLQFIDVPRERHAHREPIAKVGGIAFAVATCFCGVRAGSFPGESRPLNQPLLCG